jgi:antitoxin component of RelBE/YafQ-DinJ toxin-antitoxin module
MKRITFLIDDDLKKEFHKVCIDCGVDMSTALKAMIRGTVDQAKVDPTYPDWFGPYRDLAKDKSEK